LEGARWVAALRLLGVGFFISGAIILGVLGGLWLDDRLGTRPVLTLIGLFIGLAIAFIGVYEMLLPLLNNKSDKEGS